MNTDQFNAAMNRVLYHVLTFFAVSFGFACSVVALSFGFWLARNLIRDTMREPVIPAGAIDEDKLYQYIDDLG